MRDTMGTLKKLPTGNGIVNYFSLNELAKKGLNISSLPFSIKILLESLLRNCDNYIITEQDIINLSNWNPKQLNAKEFAFLPARVLMQDFTGVPAIVDLAALRTAMAKLGGDPKKINPLLPVDLVIDHSIQVDAFGNREALKINTAKEFERNKERYEFLKWGQKSFQNFKVVPPATGIVHQVNLEYLASVVTTREINGELTAFPDSCVGTDSHTTMINGLGVLGWGVGGIEAEAVMLGQPIYLLPPAVLGMKLTGELKEGVTATDLVLLITQILRKHGVVDKFVEFYGPGLKHLSLPDRATIANMAPEYGATMGFFPVDDETLNYLANTARNQYVDLVERYCKEQGLFRTDSTVDPMFSETLTLDLSTVEPSVAGPKRPQDRIALTQVKTSFQKNLTDPIDKNGYAIKSEELNKKAPINETDDQLHHGSIVIASITSCTNTSNPSVMIGAGLLAKKAVAKGLKVSKHIKTSLAPGSQVVKKYLENSDLLKYLEDLGFNIVAFGCTTCIGNSGPLADNINKAITENNLVVASVLSGNRNFEGRIHALTKANYLMSPPLVVAYAIAGRVDIDFQTEPLGQDVNGQPVFLKDIWPTQKEIIDTINNAVKPELYDEQYHDVFKGSEEWNLVPTKNSDLYPWDAKSTYIQEPPYFTNLSSEPKPINDIKNARVLVIAGDSVTTDHISPAGNIGKSSPAGSYLIEHNIQPLDFNSYGARRGNHEVMMRGTFANPRFRNQMTPDKEGTWTKHFPSHELMSIYEAAMKYNAESVPTIILAGKDYGMGSSRDWAAKGPALLGVKVAIADTFERIHRSNLIGMGVIPLQFKSGENVKTLGLTGEETYDIIGLSDLSVGQEIKVIAKKPDGTEITFMTKARVDTPVEVDYLKNGGILQTVLRQLLKTNKATSQKVHAL